MSITKFKLLLLCVCLLFVGYYFGRSIWHPIYTKVKGPQTVESVLDALGPAALRRLQPALTTAGFDTIPKQLRLQAFKKEQLLEVYGRDGAGPWRLVKTYPFTAMSGTLGPKLKEGDRQIPEGIYDIEYLNPNSTYHLSAKVSYPNAYDKAKAAAMGRTDLGGDIMIHGKAATVGCIPIGDAAIEELFVLLEAAMPEGVTVVISPQDFRVEPQYPEVSSVDWADELYDSIRPLLLP